MHKNEVNKGSIESLANLKAHSWLIQITLCSIIIIMVAMFFIPPVFRPTVFNFFVLTLFGIFLIIFFGRKSSFFKKRACIDWYNTDKERTLLFQNELESIQNEATGVVESMTEKFFMERLDGAEKLKEQIIQELKDFKKTMQIHRDEISKKLNNDDGEQFKRVQLKHRLNSLEEEISDLFLDDINNVLQGVADKELLRDRIKKQAEETVANYIKPDVDFYNEQIASCEKSTIELSKILKEDYSYSIA